MPIHMNRQAGREMWRVAIEKFTPRRFAAYLTILVPWAILFPFLRVMGFVDDLLFPGWKRQSTDRPVFIYANPRSGTTLLHRLMSLDEERFATFKLYQSAVPSVTVQKLIGALAKIDPYLGSPGHRLVKLINRKLFKTWDGIHKMGIDEPEEDEGTWAFTFNSVTAILLCPFLTRMPSLVWFDEQPAAVRHRMMDYYEEVMQKHLYSVGGDKHFLNKNVHFASRVHSVYERFPDGIFIYLVRHPYEALPSFLSMWHEKWKTHSPDITEDHPESIALAEMACDYLKYGLACRDLIPEDHFVVVKYADLVDHPRATIEAIYEQVGMEMSDEFRAQLDEATSQQRLHESTHDYSLEQFGLSREWVYERLKDVFDEFGFDPDLEIGEEPSQITRRADVGAAA